MQSFLSVRSFLLVLFLFTDSILPLSTQFIDLFAFKNSAQWI